MHLRISHHITGVYSATLCDHRLTALNGIAPVALCVDNHDMSAHIEALRAIKTICTRSKPRWQVTLSLYVCISLCVCVCVCLYVCLSHAYCRCLTNDYKWYAAVLRPLHQRVGLLCSVPVRPHLALHNQGEHVGMYVCMHVCMYVVFLMDCGLF